MEEILIRLEEAMKKEGTDHILKDKKDIHNQVYWKELSISNGDKEEDDSIFVTSTNLNALLNIWTTQQRNRIVYDLETPSAVRQTIEKGISFLKFAYKSKKYSEMGEYKCFSNKGTIVVRNAYSPCKGYPETPECKEMLELVPKSFNGYQKKEGQPIQFFSAEAETEMRSILSLSMYF